MIYNNNTRLLYFESFGECSNITNSCHGNGLCKPYSGNWVCSCKFFFQFETNCATSARDLFNGHDMFLWLSGLVLSVILLVLYSIECCGQIKHKKLLCNEMTIMRFVLCTFLLGRIFDYSLWGYLSRHISFCLPCEQVQLFVIYVPYYLSVLAFKICVVVWYNLIISLEHMNNGNYKWGRVIYIVISILYALVGVVLLSVSTMVDYSSYRSVLNYSITIPLSGSLIHSYIQVYRLNKKLTGATAPKAVEAYKKNRILTILSAGFTTIIIIAAANDLYLLRIQPNWWIWLIIYTIMRFNEAVNIFVFFIFSQQYTFSLCKKPVKKPLPV